MATFIRCDGCERELKHPSERVLVRVKLIDATSGEPLAQQPANFESDLCRACRDFLARQADPRNWPREKPADTERRPLGLARAS